MKFLSIFSGIGGLDLGLERAGMTCVGQVEIDPYCRDVLAKHWPGVKRMEDVRDVKGDEFGHFDWIAAGPPCQPASVSGTRRGASDDRWLWGHVLRIVGARRPVGLLAENPPGFASLGADSERVLAAMEDLGYAVRPIVLGSWAVGASIIRERVFVVATLVESAGGIGREALQVPSAPPHRVGRAHAARAERPVRHARPARPAQVSAIPVATDGIPERLAGRARAIHAVGNAVDPDVAEVIGRAIMESR